MRGPATTAVVQQSALTGEPFPVGKRADASTGHASLEEFPRGVRVGSSVISGTATMLVCATGANTRMGGMAHVLGSGRGELAFERDLRCFGKFILRIAFGLALLVILAGGIVAGDP